jgi:phage internal scaffolding protein
MKFRTAYAPHERSQLHFVDPDGEPLLGRCKQSHKDQCDINRIIKNHDRNGLLDHVNTAVANYGDYTEVNEYQVNLNMIKDAQASFDELPAHVRKRFVNDPGAFFEFASNPDNLDSMVEMGLAISPTIDEPLRVVIDEAKPIEGTPKES